MQPIHRAEPLVNQVYRFVKDAILKGEMAPGEKVVETKLAADLGVSRSPVREAMRLLIQEQLLEDSDGMICVFRPSFDDLQELYELRLAVEPYAASQAATRATKLQVAEMEKNLEQTRRCLNDGRFDELPYLNADFHALVWEMAGNSRFRRLLSTVSTLIHYYCFLVLNINGQQTNLLREHTDVLRAIEGGQASRAADAMRSHIMRDVDVIIAHRAKTEMSREGSM